MGKEPVNIARLKRQNDSHAAAVDHAHGLRTANATAQWFERDMSSSIGSGVNLHRVPNKGEPSCVVGEAKRRLLQPMDQELEAGSSGLLQQRKVRLRGKLQMDRELAEAALNAVGLALQKHRD